MRLCFFVAIVLFCISVNVGWDLVRAVVEDVHVDVVVAVVVTVLVLVAPCRMPWLLVRREWTPLFHVVTAGVAAVCPVAVTLDVDGPDFIITFAREIEVRGRPCNTILLDGLHFIC